ncbi:MAG TPA: heat-inducible transcription repressor HrcA [Clostridiales bacterium]|nr:heat-inducible transcription repressor HrcA [Clostridiales bacterium]
MELEDRKLKILQAIIQDFISTAEPVGSRTLAKKYNLGISSATIRNEMSDLEELGYLHQPHTSAGRIPSDKAYRLYVDRLMAEPLQQSQQLIQKHKKMIQEEFLQRVGELEEAISYAARLLSKMTKLISVTLSPQFRRSKLKYIQLIPIDPNSILLVIVSESGVAKNTILRTTEAHSWESLQIVSNLLNHKLKGLCIADITKEKIQGIKDEIKTFSSLIEMVSPAILSILDDMLSVNLYLEGITNIFNLPEYHDIEKAKKFIGFLDQKEQITDLLVHSKDGVDVTIGKENTFKNMQDCSLVTATYQLNGYVVGKIGIIGPTRMDYANIVSIADYVTKVLTDILKKFSDE